jgi:hypothetical protein
MNDDSKSSLPSWAPIAGLLVGAVVVMLLLWALVIKSDEDEADDSPRIVQSSDIAATAKRLGRSIYWAGERPNTKLELAESDSGRVYVRYLDMDSEAGVRNADFLTVATYPVDDPAAALRRAKQTRPGSELARSDGGALMLIDPAAPGSIRVAYPGVSEQVEVYTPDIADGIELVKRDQIEPVVR